jgi:hypothetical protein
MAYQDRDMVSQEALINDKNREMTLTIKSSKSPTSKPSKYPTSSITASNPLTVKSMGGYRMPVPILEQGSTIKDVKTHVAEAWNNKYGTNYTDVNIHLAGPGSLVGKGSEFMAYQDRDMVSREALINDKNREMHMTVKGSRSAVKENQG